LLNRIAHRMAGSSGEREVGSFAGFQVCLRAGFLDRVDIVLKGNLLHTANVSDTPLGTIRSVEYAIQNMEERLVQSLRELSDCEKQCRELESKIGQPLEHEARLQTLIQRQQELEKSLDITKNQAPNTLAADESNETEHDLQQQENHSRRELPR